MERPFFSLAKTPRTKPILYKAADVEVQVFGMPEHGMATIWDADVLIWAASQIVAAENNGLTTSRFFRFTPYHLLRAIGRPTGNRQYLLLKAALRGCNRPSSPPRSATARIGVAGNSPGSTNGRK
jgi:plasmid replication initiation protein